MNNWKKDWGVGLIAFGLAILVWFYVRSRG